MNLSAGTPAITKRILILNERVRKQFVLINGKFRRMAEKASLNR